jgi:hypothetical protein
MWLISESWTLSFNSFQLSNVFDPSNIHVVGFQQSWICPYHSLSKNLHVNIWFLPYKFNTSLYNNCHSSRQPLFIVNPHFLPTRNIPLEQKSQSQSTAQQPEPGPLWGPPELGPGDEDVSIYETILQLIISSNSSFKMRKILIWNYKHQHHGKPLRMRHPYWNLPRERGVKNVKCSEGCLDCEHAVLLRRKGRTADNISNYIIILVL